MIYIVSLGKSVTGGPETLHQLAKTLTSMGQEVSMYYVSPHINECPGRFKEYGIKAADKVVDSDENILIVPETQTYLLKMFKHIKICIWWLSLDNYLDTQPVTLTRKRMVANNWPKILFPVAFIILVAKGKIHSYRYNFEDGGKYFHTYNCEYAYQYAIKHGVPKERTLYWCGPLNHSFFARSKTMLGKLNNLIVGKGKQYLTVEISSDFREEYDALKDSEVDIEISKHSDKRSLRANAYCWVLCDRIAAALSDGTTKIDVYRNAIRSAGVFKYMRGIRSISEADLRTIMIGWEKDRIGFFSERFDEDTLILYYGTSVYSSRQMKRVIDDLIQDAQALGIPTETPEEINKMLSLWDQEQKRRKEKEKKQ